MSESEGRDKPGRRLFVLLAALAALALITAGLVRLAIDASDRDPRPRGTLEDRLALREHSDLNGLVVPKRPWFTRSSNVPLLASWTTTTTSGCTRPSAT